MEKFQIAVVTWMSAILCITSAEVRVKEVSPSTDVSLSCKMKNMNTKVGWKFNDMYIFIDNLRLTTDTALSINDQYELTRNLELTNIKHKHEGLYVCFETGTETEEVYESYRIKIKKSAYFEAGNVTKSPKIVSEGNRLDLWCNASGVPEPTVKWFIKESDTEELVDINISGRMLRIYNISRECGTTYVCQANNNYPPGQAPAEREIQLQVSFPPELNIYDVDSTLPREKTLFREAGDRVRLRCDVLSNPDVTLRWIIAPEGSGPETVLAKVTAGDQTVQKLQNQNQQDYFYTYGFDFEKENRMRAFFDMDFRVDQDFTYSTYKCEATSSVYGGNMYTTSVKVERAP